MQLVTFSECGNRWENQDYFRTEIMAEQTVLIVCDGVGGSRYGAISSKTVCDVIADFWSQNTVGSDWKKKVQEACKRASEALDKKSDECQCKDMGTTMVMAIVKDSQVTIVHCGIIIHSINTSYTFVLLFDISPNRTIFICSFFT